jgi:hypothetical protein
MSREPDKAQQSSAKARLPEGGQVFGNNDKTVKFVQLKLPWKLAEDIEAAGEKSLRSLPVEILHRLLHGGDDLSPYGWANPDRAKALGDATGVLAADIFDTAAPLTSDHQQDRAQSLAMLKIALADVLDALGASAVLEDEQNSLAHLTARRFINDLQRVEPDPAAYSQRPHLAVIARLAKLWGVKSEGGT